MVFLFSPARGIWPRTSWQRLTTGPAGSWVGGRNAGQRVAEQQWGPFSMQQLNQDGLGKRFHTSSCSESSRGRGEQQLASTLLQYPLREGEGGHQAVAQLSARRQL